MSVGINGIKRLNANNFNEITIRQVDTNDYNVEVIGDEVKKTNTKFNDEIKDMSNEDKIVAIIERYLNNLKINGITSLIELSYKDGMWLLVYGNNGNSVLRLQLFNSYFEKVKIKGKYLNDRYDFCWNSEINSFRLSTSSSCSRYDTCLIDCDECEEEAICDYSSCFECKKYVNLTLKLDEDWEVLNFEKKFIKEFLIYKFDLVGEEVKVKNVMSEYSNSLNRSFKGHIIKCGEFRMFIPHCEELMFIFGIVNDYNNELFKRNNDVKKRQLKMEGF